MRSSNCTQQQTLQVKAQGQKHQKKISYSGKSPSFVQNNAVTHQSAVTLQTSDIRPMQQTKTQKGVGGNIKQVSSQNGSLERKQPKTQKSSNSKRAVKENATAEVVLDLQRKKSQEFYPQYSKSTKVSPSIQAQQQFLGQKISKSKIIETISGHLQEAGLKQTSQFKMDAQNIQNCQQYSLRIPLTEQDRNQPYPLHVSDIDKISPSIISQTQFVMNKFQPLQNKDAQIVSGGNSVYEHQKEQTFDHHSALGEHNEAHQKSFINLIYPSMSKKIMSNNFNKFNSDGSVDQHSAHKVSQVNLKQRSDVKNVNEIMYKKKPEIINDRVYGASLLGGRTYEDEIYQSMPNFHIRNQNYNMSSGSLIEDQNQKITNFQHQMQNIHSIQVSSRERFNDQSQNKCSQKNDKSLNQNSHHQKSKSLFSISEHLAKSQAHLTIPTQASVQKVNKSSYKNQSTVFNYSQRLKDLLNDSNEISTHQVKKHQLFSQQPSPTNSSSNIIDQQFGGGKGVKNTFDKQLNHFITLGDQTGVDQSNISHTIDTYHQMKQPTPIIKGKSDHISHQQSKIHLRKPSHPVMKNNFVIEQTGSSTTAKHQSFIGAEQRNEYARDSIEARPYQHQREKKQHQPTQSKKPCHQRSSSDYLNSKNQASQPNLQQQKLKKFLNSAVGTQEDSFEIINDHSVQFQPQCFSQGVTPKGQITNKNSTSFLQQYSQALTEAQIQLGSSFMPAAQLHQQQLNKVHDHSFAQEHQNQHIANTIQSVSEIKNIYHQRKFSHQPSCQTLQAKKSPIKNPPIQQQFLSKEHYQKLAKKNKLSPKANLNHQYQMNPNTSRPGHTKTSSITNNPQQAKNHSNLVDKYSQISSPLYSQNLSQLYQQPLGAHNITQQQTQVQTSINQFLNKYQQQQIAQSQHSASATQIAGQSLKQADMKSQIIQQATKKYQDQLIHKQSQQTKAGNQNQVSHISLKKPIQSEKVSPRQSSKGKQNIVNVSIDLAKGLITTQNQSNQVSMSTNTFSVQNRQPSSNQQLRQSAIGPISGQESQIVHNSIIVRKNSFVQQQQQQQQVNTFRLHSPNSTLTQNINNKSSATLNPPENNFNKASNQIKYPNVTHQRYSVQNSPQKTQSLFQKSQKNLMQLKNQSQVSINYQQIHQSQINKNGVVSPNSLISHQRSSSFTNFKASCGTNNKSSHIDRSDSNYSLDNESSLAMHVQINQKAQQIQGSMKYDEIVRLQKKNQDSSGNQSKKQVMSETEQLLNQIRSNILQQKYGQAYVPQSTSLDSTSFDEKPIQKVNHKKKIQLCKITEASVEQQPVETIMEIPNYSVLRDQISTKKPKLLNISTQLNDDQFLYQTTDPGLSPYSKDLLKLKKMISFNFKKFNDPPVTTSEFYRIGRVLGRGAFGKVNLAAHKLSEQLAAIKSINKEFLKSEEDQRKKIMQEFAILKQSNHKSIVRLYDTFETNKHICFVMELCSGGDLLTYVRKRRKLKEDVAKYFFKQIIEGLAYIHNSKLIVHRDIKLDNILLDANGKIKICDFGVSKQVSSENEKMTEQCGTPAYIAPEILKDKGYEGFKVDVWSAGVCLYAMLVGTVPFKAASMHELHHMIINGKYELKEEKVSESAQNLIKQLLEIDWKKRLSACEVLNHPWLKDAVDELDVFTQKERDTIHKEYLSKNIDRALHKASSVQNPTHCQDTEGILTEHGLDTKTNQNSLLKNASTKSIILAPFNSTVSGFDENSQEQFKWPTEVRQMIVPKRVLKFNPKCKDVDRQYEQNNNADLDNGVYNNFANDADEENKNSQNMSRSSSSQDSLKKSFKETELSSDDEKAEQQVAESRENKLKQQTELQEFENQLKMKYVRYLEPIEIINTSIVDQIVKSGVYPRDYLIKVLNMKEMNYATATYHLLNKKQQFMQKLFEKEGK